MESFFCYFTNLTFINYLNFVLHTNVQRYELYSFANVNSTKLTNSDNFKVNLVSK